MVYPQVQSSTVGALGVNMFQNLTSNLKKSLSRRFIINLRSSYLLLVSAKRKSAGLPALEISR